MPNGIHDRLVEKAYDQRLALIGVFELSPLCNFTCRMCYVRQSEDQVREKGGLKPLSFWLSCAEQARDAGCLFPLITGGEPFAYPHFREFYTALRNMGMQVSINSNGSLIDDAQVNWLVTNPPVRINITLYGGSREAYGRQCGNPDAFDRVIRAADLLHEAGIMFQFNCSLTPYNAQDLERMLDIAKRYERGLRVSTYMFPPYRSAGKIGDYQDRLTPEQAAYCQAKTDFYQLPADRFRVIAQNAMTYTEPSVEQLKAAEEGEPAEMGCLSGRCSFWLDWQGNLSGCGVNTNPHFSLETHTFADAWQRIVEHTNAFTFSPACSNCVNRDLCFYCAACVFNETGSFNGRPQYLCEKTRYAAKWYGEFLKLLPDTGEMDADEKAQAPLPACPIDAF